ncbi:MAG: asparagine synthetase B family protein, partial [Planktothrix sp.]
IPAIFRKNLVEPLINSLRPRPEKKGLVNKGKRFIEGLENPVDLSHARWRIFAGDTVRSQLFTPEVQQELVTSSASHIIDLFHKAGDRQPQNRSMYVDVKSYLSDDILVKVDRMSMAVSLESRVPYLDPDLVELAFQIPDRLKLANGETKVLLKSIAARYVPPECVYRPKEGFSIPIKNWLCNEFRPLMEELLSDQAIREQGIFQVNTIKRLKEEHLAGTANHSHILWSLIVFQSWYKRWFKG